MIRHGACPLDELRHAGGEPFCILHIVVRDTVDLGRGCGYRHAGIDQNRARIIVANSACVDANGTQLDDSRLHRVKTCGLRVEDDCRQRPEGEFKEAVIDGRKRHESIPSG